jgi:predicted  nucleic acid-binding Zn-ribbon protein
MNRKLSENLAAVAALATVVALALPATAAFAATESLAGAKQHVIKASAYPELKQLAEQVSALITRMDSSTTQLQQYQKAKIKARDKRYSALTREFNQEYTRSTELERKLEKAPPLDTSRFPPAPNAEKDSKATAVWEAAIADERRRYELAKGELAKALKIIQGHYEHQLRVIASLHN